MNQVRGIVMVIAAAIAFHRGWMRHGERAWLAFGLSALALALAIWHFARPAQRLHATHPDSPGIDPNRR
jgi:hypothetical protein